VNDNDEDRKPTAEERERMKRWLVNRLCGPAAKQRAIRRRRAAIRLVTDEDPA
jgi:hypothetical protein